MMDAAIPTDLAPTGALRAAINLGNPVLAQGTSAAPTGVTVDIANEIGARLDLPVTLSCFGSAREAFDALSTGVTDVGFLAIEPARAAAVAFTAPYVLIEGVYVVPEASTLTTVAAVDQPGVRIAVNRGAAYDLYLTRTLQHAEIVRANSGIDAFRAEDLEAVAGIRQPMAHLASSELRLRVIDEAFMEIQQAVATTHTRRSDTVAYLHDLVEELKATGFIADALHRAGQAATVAPPDVAPTQ
jgi:polar amino acid transport system substrate-binding protein